MDPGMIIVVRWMGDPSCYWAGLIVSGNPNYIQDLLFFFFCLVCIQNLANGKYSQLIVENVFDVRIGMC